MASVCIPLAILGSQGLGRWRPNLEAKVSFLILRGADEPQLWVTPEGLAGSSGSLPFSASYGWQGVGCWALWPKVPPPPVTFCQPWRSE